MTGDERSFSLGPKFFADLRRAMVTRMTPLMVLILAIALLVHPPGVEMDGTTTWIAACVIVPVIFFGFWRGYKRQVANFQGFRLIVSPERLRRIQPGLPEMEISRNEVVRIVENPGKGLLVQGPGYQKFIGIPGSLEGFEEVRALLASWRPPEQRRSGLAQWYPILAGAGAIVAYGFVIASSNKALVTTLGTLLIGVFLYSTVAIYRSPQLDAKAKKAVWFMPFVILSVVARIWMVWNP